MVDEYVDNNPHDPMEEIFLRREEKVTDNCHNMSLLMVAPTGKFKTIREVGGSNFEIILEGKSSDNEYPKKESRKESEKEKSSSSTINPSHSLFNMEEKLDTNPYQGEIDALKPNHWLQQL
jgi:hypothetical protein